VFKARIRHPHGCDRDPSAIYSSSRRKRWEASSGSCSASTVGPAAVESVLAKHTKTLREHGVEISPDLVKQVLDRVKTLREEMLPEKGYAPRPLRTTTATTTPWASRRADRRVGAGSQEKGDSPLLGMGAVPVSEAPRTDFFLKRPAPSATTSGGCSAPTRSRTTSPPSRLLGRRQHLQGRAQGCRDGPRSRRTSPATVAYAVSAGVPSPPRRLHEPHRLGGRRGIILDCGRMNRISSLNVEERWVRVQPGLNLNEFNKKLEPHGLMFGPRSSSLRHVQAGGMLANNSAGRTRSG